MMGELDGLSGGISGEGLGCKNNSFDQSQRFGSSLRSRAYTDPLP